MAVDSVWRGRRWIAVHECPEDGAVFVTYHRGAVYCSRRCYERAKARRRRARP